MNTLILPLFFLLALTGSRPAFAGLGQPERTVEADALLLQGIQEIQKARGGVRIHEIMGSLQTVREYVSPDGVIFAVTWHGRGEPDLDELLGPYSKEYDDASAPSKIQTADFVILRSGEKLNMSGKAYCPKLMPKGFGVSDLL